jgi:tetratricopeptide (TPR) repeat protein
MVEKCKEAIKNKDTRKALELSKQAVEMHPNDPDAYLCLGIAYYKIRDFEKALENFKKAEELTDDKEKLITIYQQIGITLIDANKLDNALAYFDKALTLAKQINSNITYTLSKIAYIHYRKGNIEEAIDYYIKAIETGERENADEKTMLEVSNNFGVIAAEIGLYEEALALFKDLRNLGTTKNNLSYICISEINLGIIYFITGNKNASKKYFMLALNHAKKLGSKRLEAVTYMHIGELFGKKIYLDKAEELFREINNINN